ncbi:RNA polymerase II-associated protein [Lyophyllum atratum]|nr:RNA polymerase II-associated protein [Lyophyllum atratum]
MSSNTDALLSLRQAIKSKDPITYSNDDGPCSSLPSATHLVVSPSISLPKSSPTRYLKTGVTSASGPSDFFSVEAVYLAWLLRDAAGADYMKQARENGLAVGFVSVTERKNVVDWLEGRINDTPRIVPLASDSTTPPGTPSRAAAHATVATPYKSHAEPASSSPSKRRYVADPQDVEVVKKIKQNEVELRDRNTVLRGIKPNNFSSVRTVYAEKLKKLKESSKPGAVPTSVVSSADAKLLARKARNNFPIIMISSSPTALITMHNVKRFFQESAFEPSQEARARAAAEGNTRPEDMIPIYRKRTHIDSSGKETETQARYFVVDSVEALSKFGADAWDRVVCVMTTGQAWQFRPYKWNEPIQLFHHVKGIYVSWSNDPPNTKIKDWNVMELKIDPHRRHVDKSVVAHFWKTLDTWIVANKPWLMKS